MQAEGWLSMRGWAEGRGTRLLSRSAPRLPPPPLGSLGRAGQEAEGHILPPLLTDSGPCAITSLSFPSSEMGTLGWKRPQPPPAPPISPGVRAPQKALRTWECIPGLGLPSAPAQGSWGSGWQGS